MRLKDILEKISLTPKRDEGGRLCHEATGSKRDLWEFMRHFVPDTALFFAKIGSRFGKGGVASFTLCVRDGRMKHISDREVGVTVDHPLLWPKGLPASGFVRIVSNQRVGLWCESDLTRERADLFECLDLARTTGETILLPSARTLRMTGHLSIPPDLLRTADMLDEKWLYGDANYKNN